MKDTLTMPVAVIITGVIIAGAIMYTNTPSNTPPSQEDIELRPVDETDHILGNKDAEITIVEFSDTECPFCKNFHDTMNQTVTAYDGKVAWVYRHFPIDQLHSKARKEAEATECAAELGGNEGFWNYMNRLMEITPSNNGLELALLPTIAEEIGLNKGAFEKCLDSGKYAEKIESQVQEAIKAGAQGTPYSVVINGDGELIPIPGGAVPYESLKQGLDEMLK